MNPNNPSTRALHLTKEESLALLDLCLHSNMDMQPIHEAAIMKLAHLARGYMADEPTDGIPFVGMIDSLLARC